MITRGHKGRVNDTGDRTVALLGKRDHAMREKPSPNMNNPNKTVILSKNSNMSH